VPVHRRKRKHKPPLEGEDEFGPFVLDAERGHIGVRNQLGDWREFSLAGTHARVEVTKERVAMENGATGTYRYDELVIEGPDGELLGSISFRQHGSEAEAKFFARRINEIARSAKASDSN
jgi:hypothetical protein